MRCLSWFSFNFQFKGGIKRNYLVKFILLIFSIDSIERYIWGLGRNTEGGVSPVSLFM